MTTPGAPKIQPDMKYAAPTILFLSLFAFSAGTVLAMGADGKPFWKAQSQPDSLIKVAMTNGDVICIHPADNIRWNGAVLARASLT